MEGEFGMFYQWACYGRWMCSFINGRVMGDECVDLSKDVLWEVDVYCFLYIYGAYYVEVVMGLDYTRSNIKKWYLHLYHATGITQWDSWNTHQL